MTLDEMIVDATAAWLVRDPSRFDVICSTNFYCDILSDLASELSGSLGLAGSINAGEKLVAAQAQHGSAPDIAGKGIANPTSLILSVRCCWRGWARSGDCRTLHKLRTRSSMRSTRVSQIPTGVRAIWAENLAPPSLQATLQMPSDAEIAHRAQPAPPLAQFAAAWDCHVHVFGPRDRYPLNLAPRYIPSVASVDDLRAHANRIGASHAVLIQVSPYGTDNSACSMHSPR